MKYSVDRIENDIVILENIETKELEEVLLKNLPEDIKESSIVKKIDNMYYLDNDEKESRIKSIRERMENLKRLAK